MSIKQKKIEKDAKKLRSLIALLFYIENLTNEIFDKSAQFFLSSYLDDE